MSGRRLAASAVAAVFGLGSCHAQAQPGPPPLGDPCQTGPCRLSGAAVRVTVPLVKHPRPKLSLVVLADRPKHRGHRP